ncbi:MAG: hypothetical protein PHD15_04880 [Clostridia bacterium]|nr:hypothetical protein [Clostridia bacterium]MDD4387074.1 hypothetical protein [Clostridia bacterium]
MKDIKIKKQKEEVVTRRTIVIALLTLLVTAISLTTSTYAWFTANATVTLGSLDVNVTASNGIQISMDATNWKASLTTADIQDVAYTGHTNQVPASLVPVSSGGVIDAATGFLNMYKGAVTSNETEGYNILTATKTTEAADGSGVAGLTGDFIAFDLFIQSADAETLYLTPGADVIFQDTDVGLKNAARFALLDEGNVAVGSTAAAAQALDGATQVIFWEPNADVHTAAGVIAALDVYGITTTTTGPAIASYYGVKAPITALNDVQLDSVDALYFNNLTPSVSPSVQRVAGSTAFTQILSLNAGVTKVRVYAWIEGQDVDCENNASGSDITFNIKISKNNT